MERIKRHVVCILKTNNLETSFSNLFLKVFHDMDINDFRDFLNNMENEGIISQEHIERKERSKTETHYRLN